MNFPSKLKDLRMELIYGQKYISAPLGKMNVDDIDIDGLKRIKDSILGSLLIIGKDIHKFIKNFSRIYMNSTIIIITIIILNHYL